MIALRMMVGTILLLAGAVQPIRAQMPSPPPTGQDLVWSTVAFRTIVMYFLNQELVLSPRITPAVGMKDNAAKRREQRALQKEMPDLDRLKKWGEALEKQVSQNPPSATNVTAGAAEILQQANELLKTAAEFRKLLEL